MSVDLINRNADLRRLDEEGFVLEVRDGYLLVHHVPYVRPDKTLARGMLVCRLILDPNGNTVSPLPDGEHTMYFAGDTPCNRDGSRMEAIINNSADCALTETIKVNHYFSSKPEATGKYVDYYEKIVTYERHLGGAARSYDPSANARTGEKISAQLPDNPFAIPDTSSSRYGLGKVSRKLAFEKVAIIGLGGTGSYVLDQLSKTYIKEIYTFDGDQVLNHNLFRSPGAPVAELTASFPMKVDYYARIYSTIHTGIRPHAYKVTDENIHELAGFDFAFVCVDKGRSRELIARGLQRLGITFIDCGIGLGLEDDRLDGVTRSTLVTPGMPWSEVSRLLSFGDDDDEEDQIYKAAIQVADLNALNATLAVLRWKRWAGFYRDSRNEIQSVYTVEGNFISNREAEK
ncbi:ThiF family adenylyltransferase [Rhizobium mesosinicum]|uniref:ThiF family adenylyltransferase n=1 Tax=Rhizobium mesosinicum TaxID=335017 RepID=A0ABS7GNA0_9HYPH|nr:ThiF family adenylyltransferase [Rhizobium mesosinicum]MBW9051131.1 ThiF family adenylyltransferase [Rhizobium mesosinicum]